MMHRRKARPDEMGMAITPTDLKSQAQCACPPGMPRHNAACPRGWPLNYSIQFAKHRKDGV